MPEVRFYHLQRQTLEEAFPKLMEKVCEAGLYAVVKVPDKELQDKLDKCLWEYDPASFLPHGGEGAPYPDRQPVYLTTGDENPAGASIQVLINGSESDTIADYDRCLYMFDGRDERIVATAREAWKKIKALGWDMSYWQQRETGGWEKKA